MMPLFELMQYAEIVGDHVKEMESKMEENKSKMNFNTSKYRFRGH